MKLGLRLNVSQRNLLAFAQAADDAGWDSLWIGEHVMLPLEVKGDPLHGDADTPAITSDVPLWDVFVQLAYLAGQTKKIRLGTNVFNVGLRHPFVIARALASTDLLSSGRVEFGVGVSWLKEEWDELQLPFETRGRRADETLAILQRLFTEDAVTHEGEFFKFGPVRFVPKPAQKPWPPMLIGGNSVAALRRAARVGDGWIPMPETLETFADNIKLVREMRADLGRTGPFSITVIANEEPPSRDLLRRYAEIGVDRALIIPWSHSREGLDTIRRYGDEVIPALLAEGDADASALKV